MGSKSKIIGLSGIVILLAFGMASCDMRSLPHNKRYQYIDQVLEDVDYKNVGEIVEETIDDGDGIFAPSYKEIYYKEKSSFYKISNQLKEFNFSSCSGGDTQTNCAYGRTTISVLTIDENDRGTYLTVRDSSNGRNSE